MLFCGLFVVFFTGYRRTHSQTNPWDKCNRDISMGMSPIKMNKSTQLELSLLHNNPRISIVNIKNNGSKFTEFLLYLFVFNHNDHILLVNLEPYWMLSRMIATSLLQTCDGNFETAKCQAFKKFAVVSPSEIFSTWFHMNFAPHTAAKWTKTCEEYIADKYEDYIERFPFTTNQNNLGLVKIHLPMLV